MSGALLRGSGGTLAKKIYDLLLLPACQQGAKEYSG